MGPGEKVREQCASAWVAADSVAGGGADCPRQRVTVRVPATTANLGPGFDCLGMALDIWNEVTVERADQFSIEIEGEGAAKLPRDVRNLVCVGLETALRSIGAEVPVLRYKTINRIPFAKGLGSSSAAIVSGALAGLSLGRHSLKVEGGEELLQIAASIEGHCDNVAACIYGGLQLCIHDVSQWCTFRVPLPTGLMCVVFTPDHHSETTSARTLLKHQVDRADAVFNCSRVGLLVAAFATNSLSWLGLATKDALHQPQRREVHPHMEALIRAALQSGAHGACLSGAGPAVVAFTSGLSGDAVAQEPEDARLDRQVAISLLAAADEIGCPGRVIVTRPADRGAHVVLSSLDEEDGFEEMPRPRITYILS